MYDVSRDYTVFTCQLGYKKDDKRNADKDLGTGLWKCNGTMKFLSAAGWRCLKDMDMGVLLDGLQCHNFE